MMDALVVWKVWRRIMRETDLQTALFAQPDAKRLVESDLLSFGFSDAERHAALAYAAERDRAQWFVVNYRFRLTNSFMNALETGAPLVLRALLGKSLDLKQLGEEFLDGQDWRDYGPYIYTYCAQALQFLFKHEATASPAGLRSLISFERTKVEMLLGLSKSSHRKTGGPLLWLTDSARLHSCDVRLSAWLRDKTLLGKTGLERGMEHYLIYLPDLASLPRFALVPQRVAEIYQALAVPCSRPQLPDALVALGHVARTDKDDDYLRMLGNYRAASLPEGT